MQLRHPQAAADDQHGQPIRTPTVQERLQDLQQRAQHGDRRAMADLRALLDAHPELWRDASDLAAPAIDAWLALAAPDNILERERLQRRMRELRRRLLADDDRPLVALHVEHIVASWAQQEACRHLAADAVKHGGKFADQLNKQLATADRKYERALKQLLEVQCRLPKPAPKPATADASLAAARQEGSNAKPAAAVSADAAPRPRVTAQPPEQIAQTAMSPACPPTPVQRPVSPVPQGAAELPTPPPDPREAPAPTILPSQPPDTIDHNPHDDGLPDDTEADDTGADDGSWETTDAQVAELARKVAEGPGYDYYLAQQAPGDIALQFRPQQEPGSK